MSIYFLAALPAGMLRRSAMVAALCVCVGALLVWYHSLYCGGNIGTNYEWTSKDIEPHLSSRHNLAYGKKTIMSSYSHHQSYLYLHGSARGVDGQREQHGFSTDAREKAWWVVDLGQVETIAEIVLYNKWERFG